MSKKLEDKYVVVSASVLVDKIEQRLANNSKNKLYKKKPPTIHRVHNNIRQGNDCYDPKLISIGPLHHHKPELMHMEPLKLEYLQCLINRNPKTNSVKTYVDALWCHLQEAREQYSIDIDLTDDEFAELLLLDGCFIVEFFIKRALGPVGSPWKDTKWSLPMLRNDLLLLENQVPFFVLELIYNNSWILYPNNVELSILDLALHYISKDKVKDLPGTKEIHHLLHLHQLCLLRYLQPQGDDKILNKCMVKKPIYEKLVTAFYFAVSLLLMCKFPKRHSSKKSSAKAPRMVPCARHLKKAGIRFKKKDDACMLNVSFTEDGTLEIPFLAVQQSTRGQFENLIAFEQSCPSAGNQFTAYATFMDQIIDTAEDVAILEKCKIIESKLGSDEEVASLFNGICKGAALNYDKHYLVGVFEQLNRHCESDHNRWRAELIEGYFHNPWAIVSVIAVIALLTFTLMQTIFTMLSYWK